EQFQQWVDQLWTEKDQLIEKMKAKYSTSNLTQ
ncbi:MAG: acyltransferase, partial [Acinetobacter sp.]